MTLDRAPTASNGMSSVSTTHTLVARIVDDAAREAAARVSAARAHVEQERTRRRREFDEQLRTTLAARERLLDARERAATDAERSAALVALGAARIAAVARVLERVDVAIAAAAHRDDARRMTQTLVRRALACLPEPPRVVEAHSAVAAVVQELLGAEVSVNDTLSPGARITGADGRVVVDATLTAFVAPQRARLAMRALTALRRTDTMAHAHAGATREAS